MTDHNFWKNDARCIYNLQMPSPQCPCPSLTAFCNEMVLRMRASFALLNSALCVSAGLVHEAGGKQSAETLASPDTIARKHLISDATKSANARTRGVCCISRCMSR